MSYKCVHFPIWISLVSLWTEGVQPKLDETPLSYSIQQGLSVVKQCGSLQSENCPPNYAQASPCALLQSVEFREGKSSKLTSVYVLVGMHEWGRTIQTDHMDLLTYPARTGQDVSYQSPFGTTSKNTQSSTLVFTQVSRYRSLIYRITTGQKNYVTLKCSMTIWCEWAKCNA